jgi:hypothetical protein
VNCQLILGTQFYAGDAVAMRRQQQAIDALVRLRGVTLVNVQWTDGVHDRPELETLAVLRQDASTVTGVKARRKPIMPEIFDALADAAAARGARYFAFTNADILVSQAAVDVIEREAKEAYAFSRMDVEPGTGRELGLVADGLDLFVFTVDWWRRERHRFRPYILAEWFYDCIFGALIVCHGDGLILNRDGEIRHEAHPQAPGGSLSQYNGYLVARDAGYFTLWARYRAALDVARAHGASAADERALQREIFVWRPTLRSTVWQAGRTAKAWWKYRRLHAQMVRDLGRAR